MELDNKLKQIDIKADIRINEIKVDVLSDVDNKGGRKNFVSLKMDPIHIRAAK